MYVISAGPILWIFFFSQRDRDLDIVRKLVDIVPTCRTPPASSIAMPRISSRARAAGSQPFEMPLLLFGSFFLCQPFQLPKTLLLGTDSVFDSFQDTMYLRSKHRYCSEFRQLRLFQNMRHYILWKLSACLHGCQNLSEFFSLVVARVIARPSARF